ncbi:non-heme iron oxygenase ferredoxin subunit [Mycolicibacterium smegmatis]|uniref:Pyruvate dehydrogenase n=1 Tax=Mycolicibacterium smegmatis (strain MKD8) TaxID=1214915 RepID=A0A2U9PR16_MYCSE|nr:non-heme iron oxygenase ferredoxin subunit [Mycolicibacterium smegmatis]AWT54193.1 pyruvate dehydrogenase [Mycolicibacterium smegmatis MKD8]
MPEWLEICDEDIVDDDDVVQLMTGGHRLAIYKINGTIYVTDDRCTHQEASLADGYLDGTTIECPRHQGVFDICTGKALGPPLETNLRTYPVKIDDGRVLIDVAEAS